MNSPSHQLKTNIVSNIKQNADEKMIIVFFPALGLISHRPTVKIQTITDAARILYLRRILTVICYITVKLYIAKQRFKVLQ